MADITLTDARGAKITVSSDDQASAWESRGYTREKKATKKSSKSDD